MAGEPKNPESAGHRKVGRFIMMLPSWCAAATLFVLMIMTFADVILRSAFNAPLAAGTELTKIFMAVIVFTALPLVTWRGEGIVVDLLDPLFNPAMSRLRDIAIDLASGILLLWPSFRVYDFIWRAYNYGDTTEYLHFPQFYVVALICLSIFATSFVLILRGLAGIFRPHLLVERN